MNNPKVLVGIPYHPAKNYCIKQCLKRANELTYQNKEVVMRFDPGEYGGENNVKKQREFFRKLAISGGYDFLYFFGVDTIPPKDVIERLLACRKFIVGGVYWGRHDADNGHPDCAVAWINGMEEAERRAMFLEHNKLLQIDGMGMDCVLFHIQVLKQISWMSWVQNDDDYPYYDKAKELGIMTYLDTNVQCKHYYNQTGYTYLAKNHAK